MNVLFSSFKKEWALLWRDKMGLIFLFLLPMCLIIFITLTSSEDVNQPRQLKLLLINQDSGKVGRNLVKELNKEKGLAITEVKKKTQAALESAKSQVADGDYQALIIIPPKMTKDLERHIEYVTRGWKIDKADKLVLYFDPTLPKAFKDQIEVSVKLMAKSIESSVFQETTTKLAHAVAPKEGQDLIKVDADYVKVAGSTSVANDVQQNVPAWALFAMFFIVTPLSGTLVKERTLGVMDRIHIAPVCFMNLILGKISTFVSLNLIQLLLMLLIGVFFFPLFDMPALDVTQHPGLLLLTGVCASLAATGFGLLVGSLVRTPEQANVIGPFVIVIAAAVGGILIPSYLLPDAMQKLGEYSPLRWAHASFLDIFVRGADLKQLLPNLVKLLAFSTVTLVLSLHFMTRRAN